MKSFPRINRAYNRVFQPGRLSIGLVVPIERYADGPVPKMQEHLQRVKLGEQLGFSAVWVRDVPFNVPAFGDAGQTFDPFTYLGYLAGQTTDIALGVASVALPLHHPVHVAKSAATIDQLSDGRLILGVASGDRPSEYPAMGIDFEDRGARFRDAFAYIRKAQENFPRLAPGHFGELNGTMDILPKPAGRRIPLLMTGYSRQTLQWNAEHADGWMYYPRQLGQQQFTIAQWRKLIPAVQEIDKPFVQPLYVILEANDDYKPRPIQLGFQTGINHLIDYFHRIQEAGVNHVALNLRFNSGNIENTMAYLADKVLPHFHPKNQIVA
ncbi:LLM class flavin-dependent oxidoreductase [Flavilitoribacter nigricans DSM 23189 = NBRC 102662]|uniref:LLM class flavin-dependent oxidoreductase n=2 Tax=Flavilitoribacter TaxID=2762562 RepID=A0A2D0N2J8_FLAN2|nr:LLM class flavin-dependent oxidoreductase [Flavilitoribacter nigricans DSM 23189 = NBRC 102662]